MSDSPRVKHPGMKSSGCYGSIIRKNLSEDDGIPAELFKIPKGDAIKVLHSICQQIWKAQQWPRLEKGQFSCQSQRKAMPNNLETMDQLLSFHMLER